MRPFDIVTTHKYVGNPASYETQLIELLLSGSESYTERARFIVIGSTSNRLICKFTGFAIQINPVELKQSKWLKRDDVIRCKVNEIYHLTQDTPNLNLSVVKTNVDLHNWSGTLIERNILNHLAVGHYIRVCVYLKHAGWLSNGTEYFIITSINPLRGVLSDIYNQGENDPHLKLCVGTEFDLQLDAITEIPTCFEDNKSLREFERKKMYGYSITGAC